MRSIDVAKDRTIYNNVQAYGAAKTATILFTVALASKLKDKGIRSIPLHPEKAMDLIVSNTGRKCFRSDD